MARRCRSRRYLYHQRSRCLLLRPQSLWSQALSVPRRKAGWKDRWTPFQASEPQVHRRVCFTVSCWYLATGLKMVSPKLMIRMAYVSPLPTWSCSSSPKSTSGMISSRLAMRWTKPRSMNELRIANLVLALLSSTPQVPLYWAVLCLFHDYRVLQRLSCALMILACSILMLWESICLFWMEIVLYDFPSFFLFY